MNGDLTLSRMLNDLFSVSPCLCGGLAYFAVLTSSTATVLPTGQVAATNDNPYTHARIAKAATRLTLCATAPTARASTNCINVPATHKEFCTRPIRWLG